MLKISRAVEYGLIAVNYLREHPGLVRAKDLSGELALPPSIVAKVLQRLVAAGIVDSVQGARGGYRLAVSLDEVSFLQLSRAIEGDFQVAPCADDGECDRQHICTVSGPVSELDHRISGFLSSITIADLLQTRSPRQKAGIV